MLKCSFFQQKKEKTVTEAALSHASVIVHNLTYIVTDQSCHQLRQFHSENIVPTQRK